MVRFKTVYLQVEVSVIHIFLLREMRELVDLYLALTQLRTAICWLIDIYALLKLAQYNSQIMAFVFA